MLHARAWAGLGGGTTPEGHRVCPCDGYGHWHCTRISAPYLRAFLPGGPGTLPARRREWAWAGHLPGDCARARGLYTDGEHARARQYLHGTAAAVSRVSPQAKKVLSPLSSSSKLPCAIVPPDTPAPPQVSARPPGGHLSCGHPGCVFLPAPGRATLCKVTRGSLVERRPIWLDLPIQSGLYLWVAVFDHTQTRHSRHLHPVRLVME